MGRLPEPGLGASGPGNATTGGGEAPLGEAWETSQKQLGRPDAGSTVQPAAACGTGAPSPASGSGATSPAGFGAFALLDGPGLTQFRV